MLVYGKCCIAPLIIGGVQQLNMRGGTEPLHLIAGLHTALETSLGIYGAKRNHIQKLRDTLQGELVHRIPGIVVNGKTPDRQARMFNIL